MAYDFSQVNISKAEWEKMEAIIYKNQFWTTEQHKVREVADGTGYIIEGRRPFAQKCNKKTDQFVVRGSPERDDNIYLICKEILNYAGKGEE